MHFKSAVIVCAVNFFTTVWSAGLNWVQIKECIKLHYNHENPEYINSLPNVLLNAFGIENYTNLFSYDPNEPDEVNVFKLVLALAYNGKFDSFGDPMLTSFEVDFYLDKFMRNTTLLKRDHSQPNGNAFVDRSQLSDLLDSLQVNMDKKSIIVHSSGEWTSAAEFLSMMLTILPEGNGLNKAQIEEFIGLYRHHQTETGCIDTLHIYSIFQGFDVAGEPLPAGLFNSNRPAAKELMELMIVTAEHSNRVNNDEIVLSTKEVRSLMRDFTELDTDKDGLLSSNEAENLLKLLLSKNLDIPATFPFYDREINVAEYLLCYVYKKTFILQLYKKLFSA